MSFPSPIGGTPYASDFAPSVLFAVLYALLIPLMLYRGIARRSRTILLLGTFCFAVERVAVFALRAHQSRREAYRLSAPLATYMQVSFGMGFIGVASDLVGLVRCLLVNPTFGSETFGQSPAAGSIPKHAGISSPPVRLHRGDFPGKPPSSEPDHPRQRFWSRRFSELTSIAFFGAFIPGILANSGYGSLIDGSRNPDGIMRLRYASTAVALLLTITLLVATVWAHLKLPRVSRRGTWLLGSLALLLSVIGIYCLAVLFHSTTSLSSTAPGTLNSSGAKTSFYILHILPEWLVSVALFVFNVRQMLAAGPFGDWRGRDETPKERTKREEKEAKKEAKRAEKQKQNQADLLA